MQTGKLEALVTAALFLAPAGAVLERCVADGSLFALHPAANALAFLVFMPAYELHKPSYVHLKLCLMGKSHVLGIFFFWICSALFAMLERKQVKDHATRFDCFVCIGKKIVVIQENLTARHSTWKTECS